MMKHSPCGSLLAGAIASTCSCMAQATLSSPSELKQLSLEELMDVEVTSVSRTGEVLEEAAAAIAVVSNEDIQLDLRLAWRLQQIEVAIVGQNLWHERHVEFGAPAARGEMERSVYGKITWGF